MRKIQVQRTTGSTRTHAILSDMLSNGYDTWSVSSSPLFYWTCYSSTASTATASKRRTTATTLVFCYGGGGPTLVERGRRMRVLYKVGILSKPRRAQTPIQTQPPRSMLTFPRTDHFWITRPIFLPPSWISCGYRSPGLHYIQHSNV